MSEHVYAEPELNVYAEPELTKKVRYGRRELEDRGERVERMVDIYVSADEPDSGTQQHAVQNTAPQQHGVIFRYFQELQQNGSRAAAVCLGLLCVILLAAIISLVITNSELMKEKNTLMEEKNTLMEEKNTLMEEKNTLMKKKNTLPKNRDALLCEQRGWVKFRFGRGCYYFVREERTWEQSRQYCRERQSDLIVIDSKEKQDFLMSLNQRVWLGLTDKEEEGKFKWVDGSPLTTPTYWLPNQPDDNRGEDCVEFIQGWNDQACAEGVNQWICEIVID